MRFILTVILFFSFSTFKIAFGHGDDKAEDNSEQQIPYAETSTGKLEAVIKFTDVHAGEESELTLYLNDYLTNKPVADAKVIVEIAGIKQENIKVISGSEPGIYTIKTKLDSLRKYDFLIQVKSQDINELIAINEVDLSKTPVPDLTAVSNKGYFTIKNLLMIGFPVIFIILITGLLSYYMGRKKRKNEQ
jgi:hypothetical protein